MDRKQAKANADKHADASATDADAGETPSFAGAAVDAFLPKMFGRPALWEFGRTVSAGVTVSLVNVPLSIALSIASNCPPIYGVVTAIWAGLLAAVCGGSHFNIVGPTGALSSVLSTYAIRNGAEAIPTLALTTGLICFVFFLLHWDLYVRFLPGFVIHGFTVGVAFTIAGGQIASACGLRGLQVYPDFRDSLYEALSHLGEAQWHAVLLFVCSWVPLFVLVKTVPRVPWSIPLCVLGMGIGFLSDNGLLGDANFLTLRDKYGTDALTPRAINPQPWAFAAVPKIELLQTSLSVSFVAILETLISGRIADNQTRTAMNQRRECFGVAVANVACGVAGGLPGTAALARTALNIRSGAHNRVAGVINACSTAALVLLILPVFTYLPLPVVAALLFQVAVGMIEVKHIREYWRSDMTSFVMTLVVAAVCAAVDSSAGIVAGAIFGLLRFAKSVSRAHAEVILTTNADAQKAQPPLILSNDALHKALQQQQHGDAPWYRQWLAVFSDPDTSSWHFEHLRAFASEQSPVHRRARAPSVAGASSRLRESRFPKGPADVSPAAPAASAPAGVDAGGALPAPAASRSQRVSVRIEAGAPTVVSVGGDDGHERAQIVPVYKMYGKMTYVNLQEHHDLLQKLYAIAHRYVVLSLQHTYVFDVDGIDGLEEVDDMIAHAGRVMLLADVHKTKVLEHSQWYQHMLAAGRIFATVDDALEHCRLHRNDTNEPAGAVAAAAAAKAHGAANGHSHGGVARAPEANADPTASDTTQLLNPASGVQPYGSVSRP